MRTIRTSRRGPIVRTHPLTGLPVLPIGTRRDGSPIWPIMGGSEDAGADGGDGNEDGGDAGTDGDAGKADEGKDKAPAGETAEAKATRLEAENARLRRENASDRTSAKTKAAEDAKAELAQTIGKALGLVKDGDKAPTVEELTAQLTEQTGKTETASAAHREAQAELVVWRNAAELGVDAAALTDSRAFAAAIKDLDPTDSKFAEDVKKAAQEAATSNPKLKSTQAAGKSGAELNGGSGEGANNKPKSMAEAINKRFGG